MPGTIGGLLTGASENLGVKNRAGGGFPPHSPLLIVPTDDFSGPQGRMRARQTREDLFRAQPEHVKRLMRQSAKERREQARKAWKAENRGN